VTATGYLEISALLEDRWTGISVVTAGIANCALCDDAVDWQFFYGSIVVPRGFIESLLGNRTGKGAGAFLRDYVWGKHDISYKDANNGKAVFTTLKAVRRLFGQESMILYDFSPLLTPQFHTEENINNFSNRLRGDIETSDHFFCISKATRDDLIAYFKVNSDRISIITMEVDIDVADISLAQQIGLEGAIEPYVVVLGTLEPRKNGRLVLQYLIRDPGFASRYRVVFIGREGWMAERQSLMDQMVAAGVSSNRVIFSGYVSEAEKVALLLNCSFCIYPSYFEGYGLAILEAAKLGKLIVCSNSSSMPEVAPENSFFFDPHDIDQFARAMSLAEKHAPQLRASSLLPDIALNSTEGTWMESYRTIAQWVKA
jgi:glycosyltransferase involved in cell wall biosynthesis